MPDYKQFDDKEFTVQNLKVKADLSEDDPEVEKVILNLPGESPSKITVKPKKEIVESKKVNGYLAEDDKDVPVSISQMPDILDAINQKTQVGKVRVKATITRGIFEQDDGSTEKHFWIRNSHIEDMEIVDVPENPEKSKTEENAEDYVDDQTNIETDVETEEVGEEDVTFNEGDDQ